jgi:GR25 family glycosyltransferase involved in LPS biosynthesis
MILNVEFVLVLIIIALLSMLTAQQFKIPHVEKYNNSCSKEGIKLNDVGIFLINMKRNADRLEHFVEQYMMSDLRYKRFSRFEGIDGNLIDTSNYVSPGALSEINNTIKSGYRTKHYQLTKGAVGCYLSHISIYNKIGHGSDPYGLVFEDDVRIDSNLFSRINKSLDKIPNNWDMLLFGCHCIVCEKYENHYDAARFFLLHAYLIKKEAAKRIFDALDKKKIEQQIDSELSDMASRGELKIFCLRDTVARQDNTFQTTIQTPMKIVPGVNPFRR